MSLIRLEPHIYVYTPLGGAECHFFESSGGFEVNVIYHCFQEETKESWGWPGPMVRLAESISGMRSTKHTPFFLEEDYLLTLKPHILRHKFSPLYEWAKGHK